MRTSLVVAIVIMLSGQMTPCWAQHLPDQIVAPDTAGLAEYENMAIIRYCHQELPVVRRLYVSSIGSTYFATMSDIRCVPNSGYFVTQLVCDHLKHECGARATQNLSMALEFVLRFPKQAASQQSQNTSP